MSFFLFLLYVVLNLLWCLFWTLKGRRYDDESRHHLKHPEAFNYAESDMPDPRYKNNKDPHYVEPKPGPHPYHPKRHIKRRPITFLEIFLAPAIGIIGLLIGWPLDFIPAGTDNLLYWPLLAAGLVGPLALMSNRIGQRAIGWLCIFFGGMMLATLVFHYTHIQA